MEGPINVLPQVGRVRWIGLSPGRREPIQEVDAVRAEVKTGLVGDRHAKGGRSTRQVTLIQAEHLPVIAALAGLESVEARTLRRNVLVSGINLLALHNRRFWVGEVLLEGSGYCHPCSRMEEYLGPGGFNAMRGHGGLTALVIEAGTIKIGDEIRLAEGDAASEEADSEGAAAE